MVFKSVRAAMWAMWTAAAKAAVIVVGGDCDRVEVVVCTGAFEVAYDYVIQDCIVGDVGDVAADAARCGHHRRVLGVSVPSPPTQATPAPEPALAESIWRTLGTSSGKATVSTIATPAVIFAFPNDVGSGNMAQSTHGGSMQTTRFQLSLTTGLALALGVVSTMALLPHTAVGYPAGAAVSAGANPVDSWAGVTTGISATPTLVLTAPSGQDLVLTDILLSCNHVCDTRVELNRGDGIQVGNFYVSGGYGTNNDTLAVSHTFESGLLVPAGQSLSINTTSSYLVSYTVSGYQAQP
jgi:hypothetical protein